MRRHLMDHRWIADRTGITNHQRPAACLPNDPRDEAGEEKEMDMSTIVMVVIVVVALLAIAGAIWLYLQKRRTENLRAQFGPEYGRVVRGEGASQGERVLAERQKRVEGFDIKYLSAAERENFSRAWEHEQARFVDEPEGAVEGADRLVADVMNARGYPVGDFEQRASDVSVNHPVVVENYRIAHRIAQRNRSEKLGTEALREAMVHYHSLFAELLQNGATPGPASDRNGQNRLGTETRARAREAGR
jgi:hypothetical protein